MYPRYIYINTFKLLQGKFVLQQKKLFLLTTMVSLVCIQTFALEDQDFPILDQVEQAIKNIGDPEQVTENIGIVITCFQKLQSCMSERIAKICNESINRLTSSDFKVTDQHINALKKLDALLLQLVDHDIPNFLSQIDIAKLIVVVDKFKTAMIQKDENLKKVSINCTAQFDPTKGTTPLEQLIAYAKENNQREFRVKIGSNDKEEFFMRLFFDNSGNFYHLQFNECAHYKDSILIPTVNIADLTSERNELPFATVKWIMSFAPIKINPQDNHPEISAHTERVSPSRIIETPYGQFISNNGNTQNISRHSIAGCHCFYSLNCFLEWQRCQRYVTRNPNKKKNNTEITITPYNPILLNPSSNQTALEQLAVHAYNFATQSKARRISYPIRIGHDPRNHDFVILNFDESYKLQDIEFYPEQYYVDDPSVSLPSYADVTDFIKGRNDLIFAAFNAIRELPKDTAQSLPEFKDLVATKSMLYEDLAPAKRVLISGEQFVCRQKRSPLYSKITSDEATICSSVASLLPQQPKTPKA